MWNSTAKAYVEPIRSYLGVIQSFAANEKEISHLISVLGTDSTSEPDATIVKNLVSNVQKANTITNDFKMSDGVRVFLEKAKSGKAIYDDITPEVSQWITEHDLRNKVKVSF